jgi:acyl-CoA thioesterase-1
VAIDPALNQRDGMHPSAAGVDVIVRRILPKVEELITQAKSLRAS